jgi:hypothetical protein
MMETSSQPPLRDTQDGVDSRHDPGDDGVAKSLPSAAAAFKTSAAPPALTDAKDGDVSASKESVPRIDEPLTDKALESAVSLHSLEFQEKTSRSIITDCLGRPGRKRRFSILDTTAVAISSLCLILSIIVVAPSLSLSWHLGFQGQIIVIGFLLGVMNLCAQRVIPSTLIVIEAKYGPSRLQNYDALLTNKFLSHHVSFHWRLAMVTLLALPLALSVGYKQFLGGTSTIELKPMSGSYGLSYPIVGDWTPLNDPIYLEVSSNAAYHTESAKDTPILNGSNQYPIPYGYNILLLSDSSAAILDLPTNTYLDTMRAEFEAEETWRVSAPVTAYVATRNSASADSLRINDTYWQTALNASERGLTSYWLARDANTYIGMLPVASEASCWMAVYKGGPISQSMYSKSISEANVIGFRQTAELFRLHRLLCYATWQISATGMRLLSGQCDERSEGKVSQAGLVDPIQRNLLTPSPSSSLPHVFWSFVDQRPNSPWLMPTYAVSIVTSYWARALYMVEENQIPGYSYNGTNEQIYSTRQTLDAVSGLFICLIIQPVLTVVAFLLKAWVFLPIGSGFGLIAVLAGIARSTLGILAGAGFSGVLQKPVKLEIWVAGSPEKEHGEHEDLFLNYNLAEECADGHSVQKARAKIMYS